MSENNEELNLPVTGDGENIPNPETLETPLENQEAPVIAVAPIVAESVYTYQPTDEQGRAIGGKQVIKYTSPEDLAAKFAEQNTLLIRKLRSETKKNRLGIFDDTPVEGAKFTAPLDFNKKELTDDERFRISRNLQDPDKFEESRDFLIESSFGAKPSDIIAKLTELQTDNIQMKAKIEADAFIANNPSYVKCQENFEALTNWMLRYDLAPVRDNFQKAFDKLKADGILLESEDIYVAPSLPAQVNVLDTPVEPTITLPATADSNSIDPSGQVDKQVFAPARIPTGLNNGNSSEAAPIRNTPGSDITFTRIGKDGKQEVLTGVKAIEAMTSDELRRRTNQEKGFSAKVEKLYADEAARKAKR